MLNKMYYLVANTEDRFSRDVAHFRMVYQFIAVHQSYTIKTKKKKLSVNKILVGFDLRSKVLKPKALSTKPPQTTRYL